MTDFDSIWRTQDEIRTVVNAVLGECIWNLSYNERRMAIELEHKETPLYNKLIIHESLLLFALLYIERGIKPCSAQLSDRFKISRIVADNCNSNILSNDISFCCHWHLHVLFILLRIVSNTGSMVL